jgi:SAM-dependent methyltransferase
MNHLPGRAGVPADWYRVLRPGGRALFTDPRPDAHQRGDARSGSTSASSVHAARANERLLAEAGFGIREVQDVTEATASISQKWRDARARRREALVRVEGDEDFEKLQRFLATVHTLAGERRLSRYMYLASKPPV